MKTTRLSAAAALILAGIGAAAAAEIDKAKLMKHIRKSYNLPPAVETEMKGIEPSGIKGFQKIELGLTHRGRTQTQTVIITDDGRYYVMSEIFKLAPSKLPGFLRPQSDDGRAPDILVSPDAKHLILGAPHDASVDPDEENRRKLKLSNVPVRGNKDAPVTVVEFSDLQCPYCREAHLAIDKELFKAFGDKVRLVFKHYPLTNIHPWAMNAAIGVACAARLKAEASFAMENALFEKQGEIKAENLKDKLLALAKDNGLDRKKFEKCYDKQETKDAVTADIEEGNALGVDGTPAFFINGRKHGGWDRQKGFENLKGVVDEMLEEAKGGT